MSTLGRFRRPPCPHRHHRRARAPGAPPIRLSGPKRCPAKSSCCNRASALLPAEPCANRVVTTRRQPVVTTRNMPLFPWADHLPQCVTAPSDELPASMLQTVQRDLQGPLFAGPVQRSATRRTPSPGSRAQPDEPTCSSNRHRCQCRVPRRPMDNFGTKRAWCPGSLAVPATLWRSGRTETLI